MRKRIIGVVIALTLPSGHQMNAQRVNHKTIDCEVLEVSDPYRGHDKEVAALNYAIIRHRNPADRQRLSHWLKTQSGSDVMFTTADGISHLGVLRRLRMCFGRGLLLSVKPIVLKEGDLLTIDIQPRSVRED